MNTASRFPLLLLAAAARRRAPAQAKMKVFACEPEWGSLVHELAGDKVDVDVGTSALQDVHVIEAKPSLIAKVRARRSRRLHRRRTRSGLAAAADPPVGQREGRVGRPGSFMAADAGQDAGKADRAGSRQRRRASGWQSARPDGSAPHAASIAKALDARLVQLDPANAATYQQRLADFNTRWLAAMSEVEGRRPRRCKGRKVVVHHISWVYLWDWLGMRRRSARSNPSPACRRPARTWRA